LPKLAKTPITQDEIGRGEMIRIRTSAILFIVSIWSASQALADAPKGVADSIGGNLDADYVVKSTPDAYRLMNKHRFQYIATPVHTLEFQAWVVEPFACHTPVLRESFKIDFEDMSAQEVSKIYGKISAHNTALSKWQGRPPPCTKTTR
jgi:hypothetical protein